MRYKPDMRAAILAISLAACTKAGPDQDRLPEPTLPPTPAPIPAVAPVDPRIALEAELATIAQRLERARIFGCNLRVEAAESERNIPLDGVTWTLDTNWEKRPIARAACIEPQCIQGKTQSHTTDVPHTFSWHHHEADSDVVFIVGDPAKVIAALERAGRICKRS